MLACPSINWMMRMSTRSASRRHAPSLSRLADDGVPVHELQLLAGHSSITTTQRYMNARASSLAESMRQARERRVNRVEHADEATAQIG
jgi:integrase